MAAWTIAFTVGTLAARAVLLQRKADGRQRRMLTAAAALGAAFLPLIAHAAAPTWRMSTLAPLPFAVMALGLALMPPSPKRMVAARPCAHGRERSHAGHPGVVGAGGRLSYE